MKQVSSCQFNWLSGEQVGASTEPDVISKECLGFTVFEGPSPEGEHQMPCVGYIIYKVQWKKPELKSPFLHTGKGSGICQEPAVAIAGLTGNSSLLHSAESLCWGHVPGKKRRSEHTHPQSLPCTLLQSSTTAAISGLPCPRSSPSSLLHDTARFFKKGTAAETSHALASAEPVAGQKCSSEE